MIQVFYSALKIEKNVAALNIEELVRFLQEDKNLNNEQLEMVALVLKEQGELCEDEKQKFKVTKSSKYGNYLRQL